jgi:hypothetical protein
VTNSGGLALARAVFVRDAVGKVLPLKQLSSPSTTNERRTESGEIQYELFITENNPATDAYVSEEKVSFWKKTTNLI